MEKLLFEMTGPHKLQKGEILSLISVWCDVHSPGCVETYLDGTNPIFYYGSKE